MAQFGARRHYAVLVLLHRAEMLAHCCTDAYAGPGRALRLPVRATVLISKCWRPKAHKCLLARRANGLPLEKVSSFNCRYSIGIADPLEPLAKDSLWLIFYKIKLHRLSCAKVIL